MKQIILGLALIAAGLSTKAQSWTSYNYQSEGYPVTVKFPSSPTKTPAVSRTDTMITLTSGSGGVTYVLIATRVESANVAAQTAARTNKKLAAKAKKVDLEQASSVAGVSSNYMKYVSQKDTYIMTHAFSSGRVMYQAMVMKPKMYTDDNQANTFFSAIVLGAQTYTQPVVNQTASAFKVRDRVEIYWPKDSKWYKGTVTAVNTDGTYRVNYDGYDSKYDENVTADKLKLMGNTTTVNNNTGTTNVSNTNTSTNTGNNTATTTNASGTYAVNDRVEVLDTKDNKWFRAIVLKVNTNNTYRVAYDGYAETYDEDMTTDRMRPMSQFSALPNVTYVKTVKGQTTKVSGNLRAGAVMEDLEFATTSQMACWPNIRDVEFQGNQVAYWMDMPKKSIVRITVTPRSTKTRINIYGYSSIDPTHLPPNVLSCTSCEASHPTWIGQPDMTIPAGPQSIEFNATTRHNTIYFAVTGAQNVLEGDYDITIEIK